MKKNINDFYDFLVSNEDLKRKISLNQFIQEGKKIDKEKLKKVISSEIIPIARKNGFDLTVEEILNRELSNESILGEENLAEVSGGINPKTAGVILSLLTVGSGALSSGANLDFAEKNDINSSNARLAEDEALQVPEAPPAPEAPAAPAAPPPPSSMSPIQDFAKSDANKAIPKGFSKIEMPKSNEEIKNKIGFDLSENFDEIKENCVLLQDKDGDILIYNTSDQKLWAKNKNNDEVAWLSALNYSIQKGRSLKKAHTKTSEERKAEIEAEKVKMEEFKNGLSVKDRIRIDSGKAEIYQREDGTLGIRDKVTENNKQSNSKSVKIDFSKKVKLDASKLDAPSALGMFSANIKVLEDEKSAFLELTKKGINAETTDQARKLIAKFNEILEDLNASSNRIFTLYTEARKSSSSSPVTLRSTLSELRKQYNSLINEYNAIVTIYSRFGLDAKDLRLVNLPDSPLPLPKKIELEGVDFTYSDEENKLEISSKSGQKVVITLELLKELGVRDKDKYTGKPVIIELVKNYELDENCSKLLELKFDSNGVSGFIKRQNSPSLEDVYEAMDAGEGKLQELIGKLPTFSNSKVTYNAKPVAKKVSVEEANAKDLLTWKMDQATGNITANKGNSRITYNKKDNLFEVKGSPVVLEIQDINNIESLLGTPIEKINYKIKGKIVLGQSLLNSGWQDSTGYFFGNYSYSRLSDNVKTTSTEDVVMYKYKDGSVYIVDNRDDKSMPIVLNDEDLNKIEKEYNSTKIWSRSKIEISNTNWTKHNSWRYYGFEKK